MPWSGLETERQAAVEASQAEPARDALRRRSEAALEVWAASARRAVSTASAAVAQAARTQATTTTVGMLRFEESGDALVPGYVASTWRDGDWRPLDDKAVALPPAPIPLNSAAGSERRTRP